jgi:hypothetical protein
VEEAMNGYLTWEIELVHQIERDDTVAFGTDSLSRSAGEVEVRNTEGDRVGT